MAVASRLLRRHVSECAENVVFRGVRDRLHPSLSGQTCQTKIQDVRIASLVHQDVCRFQISMIDAVSMSMIESIGNACDKVGLLRGGWLMSVAPLFQIESLHQFRGQVKRRALTA